MHQHGMDSGARRYKFRYRWLAGVLALAIALSGVPVGATEQDTANSGVSAVVQSDSQSEQELVFQLPTGQENSAVTEPESEPASESQPEQTGDQPGGDSSQTGEEQSPQSTPDSSQSQPDSDVSAESGVVSSQPDSGAVSESDSTSTEESEEQTPAQSQVETDSEPTEQPEQDADFSSSSSSLPAESASSQAEEDSSKPEKDETEADSEIEDEENTDEEADPLEEPGVDTLASQQPTSVRWSSYSLSGSQQLNLVQATKSYNPFLANGAYSLEGLRDILNQVCSELTLTYGSGEKAVVSLTNVYDTITNGNELLAAIQTANFEGEKLTIQLDKALIQNQVDVYARQNPEQFRGKEWQLPGNSLTMQMTLGSNQNKAQVSREQLDAGLIDTVSPANVTINLFDYAFPVFFANDVINSDYKTNGYTYLTGINAALPSSGYQSHALTFDKSGGADSWNAWTGTSGGERANLVRDTLGADGFPQLNLKNTFKLGDNPAFAYGNTGYSYSYDPEESLNYLFNPAMIGFESVRKAFTDVKGMLKIDEVGNYRYDSHENFAEYDYSTNRFRIYNNWGINKGGSSPNGQFFPFNTGAQVFGSVDANGILQPKSINSLNQIINHYLGLSMEVEFQQPMDGLVSVSENNFRPMVFEFAGDDDVWIFIDDVLVADLGGIHDEMQVSIDFNSGDIKISRASNPNVNTTKQTTLKQQFEKAGKQDTVQFKGNTFAGNTTHTLKMFYLERGNTDSNLVLSFNLMAPVNGQIMKVDEHGDTLTDASFDLYVATVDNNGNPVHDDTELESYQVEEKINIAPLTIQSGGSCQMPNYDYSQHTYYILRESTIPNGYFSTGDILLRYDKFQAHADGTATGTNLLMVENQWATGARMNFVANVYQAGDLHFEQGGSVDRETAQRGIIVGVPLLNTQGQWVPLYGSGLAGYQTVSFKSINGQSDLTQRQAIVVALLSQIYGAQYNALENYKYTTWTMEWDEENDRFAGTHTDLPGDAQRYYWASGNTASDMAVAYYFVDLESLSDVFGDISNGTTQEKLDAIADVVAARMKEAGHGKDPSDMTDDEAKEFGKLAIHALAKEIEPETSPSGNPAFGLLDLSEFNRLFSSRIYVPNIQPEIYVQKLDENGLPVADAYFSLFATEEDAKENKNALLTTKTDANGYAVVYYRASELEEIYLRETAAPTGYVINDEIVPIRMFPNGRVYADALEENDGITVRKGLGVLVHTMARYAQQDSVNITLRDITAKLLIADDFGALMKGEDNITETPGVPGTIWRTGQSLNLHYGLSNALLEYGTHAVNGIAPNPYFEVDSGIPALGIHQNYTAHQGDPNYQTIAEKNDLRDTNIRGLFTGSTGIIVRNRSQDSQGRFSIQKFVTASNAFTDQELEAERKKLFAFDINVTGQPTDTNPVPVWPDTQNGYDYTITKPDGTAVEQGKIQFAKAGDGYKVSSVTPDPTLTANRWTAVGNAQQVLLAHEETLTVTGMPFGLVVQVQEVDSADAMLQNYTTNVSVNEGIAKTSTSAQGVVTRPVGNPFFRFYNHLDKYGTLVLTKTVADQSTSQKFPFAITLQDSTATQTLSGQYDWVITDVNGATIDHGTIEGTGHLTVNLGSGDTLKIEKLPIGTRYRIVETPMGYRPEATVNGAPASMENNVLMGQISGGTQGATAVEDVVAVTNTRSASITITKRTTAGTLLNGAGFTLYQKDADGKESVAVTQRFTSLAERTKIGENDQNFNKDMMRYNLDGQSYIVHTLRAEDGTASGYYYYRPLTSQEASAFNSGRWDAERSKNVEAIVQFSELPLTDAQGRPIQYKFVETRIPDGYLKGDDVEWFTLPAQPANGGEVYDVLYSVANFRSLGIPFTGLNGFGILPALGLVITTVAVGWAIAHRKRKI